MLYLLCKIVVSIHTKAVSEAERNTPKWNSNVVQEAGDYVICENLLIVAS